MAAAEEIWMPRKVHNHELKSVYPNDGQRQEWSGCLGHIRYNKLCKAGMRTGSHGFLYLSVSNAQR